MSITSVSHPSFAASAYAAIGPAGGPQLHQGIENLSNSLQAGNVPGAQTALAMPQGSLEGGNALSLTGANGSKALLDSVNQALQKADLAAARAAFANLQPTVKPLEPTRAVPEVTQPQATRSQFSATGQASSVAIAYNASGIVAGTLGAAIDVRA